ncbi:MAG TPA: TIR domain-containing protein [Methanosphaera sp.]|nr:TIR domain-containing protein [Methanosphaera sp.]
MLDRTPNVFISYSWTSEEFKNEVIQLAEQLVRDAVNVKLDVWDLKEGQDKYKFMEQCVSNPEIDKVLIICDKVYAKKADARIGGVGDETTIISPEIYKNASQKKFIPVIMEHDKNGEPYMPAYLKSRLYIDLVGDNYSTGYESLLRNIYEQPAKRKPELGERPDWLDEDESSALYNIKEANRKIQFTSNIQLKSLAITDFIDDYLISIKPFYQKEVTNEQYLDSFKKMKEHRDVFLDHIKIVHGREVHFGRVLADAFERMYNEIYNVKTFEPNSMSCNEKSFDLFRLHIWELFVCTVTYLIHKEAYSDLYELLHHTYYLRVSPLGDNIEPSSYQRFRFYSEVMEERIKPSSVENLKNKYTLTGNYLCNEREYLPIYSGVKMANADLFLYQVYNGLGLDDLSFRQWFPTCYVYADMSGNMWKRLQSRGYCGKIMPLFGVNTIDDLKKKISLCKLNPNVRYRSALPVPAILSYIKVEDIGTLI